MQVTTTLGAGYIRHGVPDAKELSHHFPALFVLAGAKTMEPDALRKRLRLSEDEFDTLLHRLQMGYLVDVVSERKEGQVVDYLRLTEEGSSTLQRMLERMCELPELD
jgi:DNA-binding PadR family transcriptional regulator